MGLFDDLQGTAAGRASGGADREKSGNKLQVIPGGVSSGRGSGGSVKGSTGRATKTGRGKTGKQAATKTGKQAGPGAGVVGRGSVPVVRGAVVSDAGESGAGDVVTASGVDASLLPGSVSDVGRLLPAWVAIWCERVAVDDLRKISPLVFGSLCIEVGEKYIRPSKILKDTEYRKAGKPGAVGAPCNAYKPEAVIALYDDFRRLCSDCDKIPFYSDFADFCGVSRSYIMGYGEKLTSVGLAIGKKAKAEELEAVRRSSSRDPVGRLAILNNEYWAGSNGGGDSVQVQAVDSIPAAASFGLLPGGKLE